MRLTTNCVFKNLTTTIFKLLIQFWTLFIIFPSLRIATLKNKIKLAAINGDNHEEHPKNSQALDTNIPRYQDDYITKVSDEIEGRVTKKLSQKFSRTESHIVGALSNLDEFLPTSPGSLRTGSEDITDFK